MIPGLHISQSRITWLRILSWDCNRYLQSLLLWSSACCSSFMTYSSANCFCFLHFFQSDPTLWCRWGFVGAFTLLLLCPTSCPPLCLAAASHVAWCAPSEFALSCQPTRLTKQPHLSAIVQSRRLSLFGHIARMPDETDAKQILTASPAGSWTRPLGRPRITWMKTIQQDLKSSNLNMDDAVDLAQNRPLWRLMSTFGATHS